MVRVSSGRKNLAQLDDMIAGFKDLIRCPVSTGIGQRGATVGSATPSADDEFAVGESRA
jgi:hypothetical protein